MTDRARGPSGAKAPAMSAALAAAPVWRREPYRVFFPLGALLAWAGVLHWFLHSVGLLPDYQPVFHSIVQIQGFMMCFAVGFLFTAIPRRTGTAPPAGWQIGLGLAAPIGTTVAAWLQRFALSQFCWLVLVVVLITFAVGRLRSGRAARRPPDSFVWVPLALLMGCVGALLIGAYGLMGPDYFWLHDLGRLLLLQGMFLGLVLGVGGLVLPLLIRNDPPPDGGATPRSRGARLAHLAAAILLVASFWIENSVSLRGGYALRAALILVVLLAVGRIWRWPTVPGWHRWLVWLTAWLIPAGYVLAALFPFEKKAGLHVVFIGGFALMAFAVGTHVTLAHGGYERTVRGRPWQVPVFGFLFLLAMVLRALIDFDPARFFLWLGASAATFLVATLFWAWLVLPRAWREAGPEEKLP